MNQCFSELIFVINDDALWEKIDLSIEQLYYEIDIQINFHHTIRTKSKSTNNKHQVHSFITLIQSLLWLHSFS